MKRPDHRLLWPPQRLHTYCLPQHEARREQVRSVRRHRLDVNSYPSENDERASAVESLISGFPVIILSMQSLVKQCMFNRRLSSKVAGLEFSSAGNDHRLDEYFSPMFVTLVL
jgi:hypothetical protein